MPIIPFSDANPLKLGLPVDDNATRFSNYFHVLRETIHWSNGWLPLEPAFHAKYTLGEHIHDDARGQVKVRRRIYELRANEDWPGAPSLELATQLDRLASATSPAEHAQVVYGQLKPALVRAIELHVEAIDAITDEVSLIVLRQLLERQRQHIAEATAYWKITPEEPFTTDLGALEIRKRETRALQILPRLDEPARDDFITVTPDGDPFLGEELYVNGDENHVPTSPEEQQHFFHGLMDAELCAAELMARNSHEYPDMPWDFHVDMARQTWDELRHARVHEVLMSTELGCKWGDFEIGFDYFKSIYAFDLTGRLLLFNGTSEQKAMWRHSHRRQVLLDLGQANVAKVFDYLLADEVPHVHNGVRWGTHLLGGDPAAYRSKMKELREGLDRTGQPVNPPAAPTVS
ncbi:MAG: hypothetical protein JWO69_1499 [Thermoleophilia bacterium]|jgi:hypothetical protein|nr:hypothetical protein [Thermoleophilia bacterium]